MLNKFKISAKNLKSTRCLCTAAILSALFVVLYSIKLQVTPDLRITFTFIPLALAGWLLGPVPAMLTGIAGDLIGCLLFPAGSYFFGFTLTKMLAGLVYGIFLYDASPKKLLLPTFFSTLTINMLLNVALNALWLSMMYGKAWSVYAAAHLVKNIITLPIEMLLLIWIIKIMHSGHIEKMYKQL